MKLLELRGFGGKWTSWIQQLTHGGSVGVKLNNCESDFFSLLVKALGKVTPSPRFCLI